MTTAIFFINLGGPANLEEIKPFLFDLFMDRNIIPIPVSGLPRRLFANMLAKLRFHQVRKRYEKIGGGSPLVSLTQKQAQATQEILEKNLSEVYVVTAMRYGKPSIESVFSSLKKNTDLLIAFPLFPQYCKATTGTAWDEFKRAAEFYFPQKQKYLINPFGNDVDYQESMASLIHEGIMSIQKTSNELPFVLFCAHSVPAQFVEQNDPYVSQIEKTSLEISRRLNLDESEWTIAYQSQVGPVKWVGPTYKEVLTKLASNNISGLVLVPISFVSEHLETLYDMDYLIKSKAEELGIRHVYRVPCLNTNPQFIDLLAKKISEIAKKILVI